MAHVAEWKYREVEDIQNLVEGYPVVGIANITKVRSSYFQKIRHELANKAKIKVSKLSLITKAFERSKNKKLKGLSDHFKDQVALILTKENPFRLHKFFEDQKMEAAAKAGDVSPKDIVMPKGDTDFRPGPILSELQQAGVKARIERGKVVVTEDSTLVARGETISEQKAMLLDQLEIKPLTIGISLLAAYEDGEIFTSDILKIDEEQIRGDLAYAHNSTLNLAYYIKYPTSETIGGLLSEAYNKARNLALYANIVNKSTVDIIVQKAYSHLISLASEVSKRDPSLVPDHLKPKESESKQETKPEEKKEDAEEKESKEEDSEEVGGLGALFG